LGSHLFNELERLFIVKILAVVVLIAVVAFVLFRAKSGGASAQENVRLGADFLATNMTKEGVVSTESGLQYKVLQPGTGSVHPQVSDKVKVHYHGTLVDGTVFDSSVDRGQAISFGLNQVIKGWTEGLQLMVVGEKTRLFIPADLAYGNRAAGAIPPGSVLIFDVELLGINE
jgi:peptidylprolyl isomerase